jgi:5-methyltetrahydropteroyltriglutamate--homocysteine methyltransferase
MDNGGAMLVTMIVGSLPRPSWLAEPTGFITPWRLDDADLEEGQDDAVRLALRDQEEAGLDIVTDGEQRRRHYVWTFCEALEGIDPERRVEIPMRGERYTRPAPVVSGPVRRSRSVFLDALRFSKAHTTKPVKVTLPSPMTMADSLADEHYGDRKTLAFELAKVVNEEACELAEAGCDIVQFDEPCFNIYLDEIEEWGLPALEEAARGVTARTAVHICYGYGVAHWVDWKAKNQDWSQYHHSLPLLRTSSIDQISVECAASGVDPSVLALAGGKDLMVGVIDCGTDEIETPDAVAQRIRAALEHVSPERLYPSTDCGLVPRSRPIARAKMQALAHGAKLVREEIAGAAVAC